MLEVKKISFQTSGHSTILVICQIEFAMAVNTIYISFKINLNPPTGLLCYLEIDF